MDRSSIPGHWRTSSCCTCHLRGPPTHPTCRALSLLRRVCPSGCSGRRRTSCTCTHCPCTRNTARSADRTRGCRPCRAPEPPSTVLSPAPRRAVDGQRRRTPSLPRWQRLSEPGSSRRTCSPNPLSLPLWAVCNHPLPPPRPPDAHRRDHNPRPPPPCHPHHRTPFRQCVSPPLSRCT